MKAVVVCTKYRGVFFGYVDADKSSNGVLHLAHARMCVYWEAAMHGVLGLASAGPSEKCRVSGAVDSIELRGVTAVIDVSSDAVGKWEAAPWG